MSDVLDKPDPLLTEEQARRYLESLRWPEGPACPHCGATECKRLRHRQDSTARPGLWRCAGCRRQFTVTVKTIFDGSKLPLLIWLRAVALLCARPKGIPVRQLQEELAVSYRGAWAITDRIRYAATQAPFPQNRRGPVPRRMPGPAKLYPLSVSEALVFLLRTVPERKHPEALERRHALWEQRSRS
ncbi:MAG TPA: IS1595 family transposase [Bryobacteraceae bacterium]|nr:IS1595 family transposase [Bryobacteraceae bacterium]